MDRRNLDHFRHGKRDSLPPPVGLESSLGFLAAIGCYLIIITLLLLLLLLLCNYLSGRRRRRPRPAKTQGLSNGGKCRSTIKTRGNMRVVAVFAFASTAQVLLSNFYWERSRERYFLKFSFNSIHLKRKKFLFFSLFAWGAVEGVVAVLVSYQRRPHS